MIYKISNNEVPNSRGREKSDFRIKIDNTLSLMNPESSFFVNKKRNMNIQELQNRISAYTTLFSKKTGKKFMTHKCNSGIRVKRVA